MIKPAEDVIFFKISGVSMRPFFRTGDIFIVRKTPAKDLKIGDILSYKSCLHEKGVSHRLVRKVWDGDRRLLYTRGDACFALDEPIDEAALSGRAIAVVRNGRVLSLVGRGRSLANRVIILISPWMMIAIRLAGRIYHMVKK